MCSLLAVIAGWAKPQQSCQQPGCTALSGKQEGVWEESDSHRGAELGGRLSFPHSPLFTIHHPLIMSLQQSFFYLILNKTREKNSYIWRTHTPPRETRNNDRTESNQTGLDINFANTWGKQLREIGFFFLLGLLVINFTFCIAWCEISYF